MGEIDTDAEAEVVAARLIAAWPEQFADEVFRQQVAYEALDAAWHYRQRINKLHREKGS